MPPNRFWLLVFDMVAPFAIYAQFFLIQMYRLDNTHKAQIPPIPPSFAELMKAIVFFDIVWQFCHEGSELGLEVVVDGGWKEAGFVVWEFCKGAFFHLELDDLIGEEEAADIV